MVYEIYDTEVEDSREMIKIDQKLVNFLVWLNEHGFLNETCECHRNDNIHITDFTQEEAY